MVPASSGVPAPRLPWKVWAFAVGEMLTQTGQTTLHWGKTRPALDTAMNTDSSPRDKYRVVALRYRPGNFEDLIGQSQVATALRNAIQQQRVGHAYLFTGARGVGKTSSARIFAKCLNCQQGPTVTPCGECDICQSIATGEDVDVLEIDGASNRGIDEIRQLRANVSVRPSRARYKIYIIDEVHMLTVAAFNALLKTLEEPPDHVKFIFCTTDPEKIPITVLSRCQRFDFPPIRTPAIVDRLRHIVQEEGIEADDKALELLARRAGGSMRDSQSLLEQLLSWCQSERISVKDVHALLGTADNDAVFALAEAMVAADAATALTRVHEAVEGGVDAGQLTDQLLGLFRDAMACLAGCGEELLLQCSVDDLPRLQALCEGLGVEKTLTILQVLDQTLVKARYSTSLRTLLETTVVRCCYLQNIDLIPQLMQQLQTGSVVTTSERSLQPAKKKPLAARASAAGSERTALVDADGPTETVTGERPAKSAGPAAAGEAKLEPASVETIWRDVLAEFSDLTAESAGNYDSLDLVGDRLVVKLKSQLDQNMCDRPGPKQRLEQALQAATGRRIRLDFRMSDQPEDAAPRPPRISRRQRIRNAEQNEFVKSALELLDGEILEVKPPADGR
jgi:DNA polymerase-3 subunit gamma/tau